MTGGWFSQSIWPRAARRPSRTPGVGAGRYHGEYFVETMGRPPMDCPQDKIIEVMSEWGAWVIGTPDDCIQAIESLAEASGGFGGFLIQTVDWAPREKVAPQLRIAGPLRYAPLPGLRSEHRRVQQVGLRPQG